MLEALEKENNLFQAQEKGETLKVYESKRNDKSIRLVNVNVVPRVSQDHMGNQGREDSEEMLEEM